MFFVQYGENISLSTFLSLAFRKCVCVCPSAAYSPATKCVALARVGQTTQKIAYGSMADLLTEDMVGSAGHPCCAQMYGVCERMYIFGITKEGYEAVSRAHVYLSIFVLMI